MRLFVAYGVNVHHTPVRSLDKPGGLPLCPNLMKELLRTNDPTLIAFALALLEGEDIDVFEMDVHMSVLEGSIGILPRRLMVREADLFRASAVLKDNDIPLGT